MADRKAVLQAINGFLQKTDGRDKLTATLQYACMFIAAGQPGMAKDIQVKIAAARKVFRVLRPLETLTPIIKEPYISGRQHVLLELLPKLKALLMTVYFGADHVVWAGSVGLVTDKQLLDRAQKSSLWGWFLGSLCTITQETLMLAEPKPHRKDGESDEDWALRNKAAIVALQKRTLVLVHAVIQALLAMGLLQLRPWKPRFVGFLGVAASALNCYMLFPTIPFTKPQTCAAPDMKPALKSA